MKKKIEIGIATITYSSNNIVETATFEATMKVEVPPYVINGMEKDALVGTDDVESVKAVSDMALASYFTQMNEIELADREKYEVVSKVIDCEKYDDGTIKKCTIKYFFQHVPLIYSTHV